MRGATHLRAQAIEKRNMADMLRRTAPGLSLIKAQEILLQHAQELDAEAARLEARVDYSDGSSSA